MDKTLIYNDGNSFMCLWSDRAQGVDELAELIDEVTFPLGLTFALLKA